MIMQKTYISLMATLLLGLRASAIVFTNDTLISPLMTNYDGLDIVISNSVLTVDGPHSFASLRAATGSTLTHSASASGMVNTYTSISDEPQLLTSTNPATLANANILPPSVIVRDLTDTITYTNNVDYTVGMSNQFTTLQRTPASFIPDGATVLVSYQFAVASTNAGLFLTINGDLEVESGAAINVNSRDLAGGTGSGRSARRPLSGGGGAYGGFGGPSSSNAPGGTPYGSPFEPATLGSSGGGSYAGS